MTKLLFCCAALAACAAIADDGLWRPAPHATQPPYPKKTPREPRQAARLATMTLDGTFESFDLNSTVLHDWLDEICGNGSIFGNGAIRGNGVAGQCVTLPPSHFGTVGFEEKNFAFKPNAWYRVEFMIKGVPYRICFSYPREAPDPADPNGRGHLNDIIVDHNHGSHVADFCLVCSACGHVKWGAPEDGDWKAGGFREPPAQCPECDAAGTLYRDGMRRPYHDWTLVYEDFKTGDYTGQWGPYYWFMIMVGWDCEVSVDNLMVYEITGEGGEAVGGDEVTDLTPEGRLLPPALVKRRMASPTRHVSLVASHAGRDGSETPSSFLHAPPDGSETRPPAPCPIEYFFSAQRPTLPQETDDAMRDARQRIANEWGVPPPAVRLTVRADLKPDELLVHVLGEPAWQGVLPATKDEAVARAAALLPELYRQHARGLLTERDARVLLDRVRERHPVAVAEAERALGLPGIHAALCALLADGHSILQLPAIVDALAVGALETKDPAALAQRVKTWLADE